MVRKSNTLTKSIVASAAIALPLIGAGALVTALLAGGSTARAQASEKFQLPKGAVAVVAYLQALGGKENKLGEISTRLMGEARAGEPGTILFYEIFETEKAFQAHKDAEHTKRWFRETEPLVAGPIEVFVLSAV